MIWVAEVIDDSVSVTVVGAAPLVGASFGRRRGTLLGLYKIRSALCCVS